MALLPSNIWQKSTSEQQYIVSLFKDIFIEQRFNDLHLVFSSSFGTHNGYNLEQYVGHEMEEFFLKCTKFGLNKDCLISTYLINTSFIYFSLGKKDDCALFEAIFQWDEKEKKLKGNQYYFKIEPKIQFTYRTGIYGNLYPVHNRRRINITPPLKHSFLKEDAHHINSSSLSVGINSTFSQLFTHNTQVEVNTNIIEDLDDSIKVKNVLIQADADDFQFIKTELPAHLGGNFYSLSYKLEDEVTFSFWDKIRIFSSEGVFTSPILMRGIDHPLFIPDLIISATPLHLSCKEEIYPVVVYILFADGEEVFYKYPTERFWEFTKPVKKICLTDPLSFDWIIEF